MVVARLTSDLIVNATKVGVSYIVDIPNVFVPYPALTNVVPPFAAEAFITGVLG